MGYNITEIDGAPTVNGRLPVSADLDVSGVILKVSAAIMKTKHFVDHDEVNFEPNEDTDIVYKTYPQFIGKYLRELMVGIEKKETVLSVYINNELYSEMNFEQLYEYNKYNDSDNFSQYISVNKNKKIFIRLNFLYDNTPINGNIELRLRYSSDPDKHTHSVKMNHVYIVYNEAVMV